MQDMNFFSEIHARKREFHWVIAWVVIWMILSFVFFIYMGFVIPNQLTTLEEYNKAKKETLSSIQNNRQTLMKTLTELNYRKIQNEIQTKYGEEGEKAINLLLGIINSIIMAKEAQIESIELKEGEVDLKMKWSSEKGIQKLLYTMANVKGVESIIPKEVSYMNNIMRCELIIKVSV